MTSAFISQDDGYTINVFIKGIWNMYPDVEFSFRPSTIDERSLLVRWHQKAKRPQEGNEILAKAMSKKLVGWNIKDDQGAAAEISVENLLRLNPDLFTRMYNIVAYMLEGGDKPEGSSEESLTDPGDEYLAELEKN